MRFTLRSKLQAEPTTDIEKEQATPVEGSENQASQTASADEANRRSASVSDRTQIDPERRQDIHTTEKADHTHPHGTHGEELIDFPTLNYGLYHRRRRTKIAFYGALLFLESFILPEALFYGLTFGKPEFPLQDTFAIITALCGTFSPIKFFLGMFKLWRKKTTDRCRPLGQSNRLGFDFTHIAITIGYWIFIIILIIGTAPHDQITPLIALAGPAFCLWSGAVLLFLQLMHHAGARAPFRISSTQKGEMVKAAVYPFVEDICAVEGHGNREYRERLKARYEASPVFRKMLVQISWFWIIGSAIAVAASAAVVATTKWYVGFGFGWGIPFVWGYIWAATTTIYVSHMLKKEKATWNVIRHDAITTQHC